MGWLNGQNLVLGIVEGGIYGLLAVGIVLVYRGSRVLNFAQGEIGTVALVVAWYVSTDWGLPWIVGAAAGLAAATLVGLLQRGYQATTTPTCPLDFSNGRHDGSGGLLNTMESYRAPNGKVNWRSPVLCKSSF